MKRRDENAPVQSLSILQARTAVDLAMRRVLTEAEIVTDQEWKSALLAAHGQLKIVARFLRAVPVPTSKQEGR